MCFALGLNVNTVRPCLALVTDRDALWQVMITPAYALQLSLEHMLTLGFES